jgi:hypothetical protein
VGLSRASGASSDSGPLDTEAAPLLLKPLIWDLGETFWTGTLREGEVEIVAANVAVVRELNRRGIVNAICSKNDFEQVQAGLVSEASGISSSSRESDGHRRGRRSRS